MVIPKHDEIRIPALKLLQKLGMLKLKDFEKPLAEQFGLGMQVEHTIEIKKLDSDFWDGMGDDSIVR